MFHPDILAHYVYRIRACESNPVDACADVAQFEGVNIHTLAAFLRTIGAVGAHRLTLI